MPTVHKCVVLLGKHSHPLINANMHYEFVVNGVHRNPRRVKLPHAAPVPKTEMARFQEHSKPLMSQLETERTTYFARLNEQEAAGTASNSKLQK